MKHIVKILCGMLVSVSVASFSYAAQLYRWVDSKGNVEWRDTPPPASAPAKNVEQRKVGGNIVDTGDAPYSVQQASKNHPVTFWGSTDCGKMCDGAKAHLTRRGVPFTEKGPQTDLAGFKKISPSNEVPILQVGVITLKGYLESEWDSTLDSAGYPRTVVVRPKPAAAPAAPATKPAADAPQK